MVWPAPRSARCAAVRLAPLAGSGGMAYRLRMEAGVWVTATVGRLAWMVWSGMSPVVAMVLRSPRFSRVSPRTCTAWRWGSSCSGAGSSISPTLWKAGVASSTASAALVSLSSGSAVAGVLSPPPQATRAAVAVRVRAIWRVRGIWGCPWWSGAQQAVSCHRRPAPELEPRVGLRGSAPVLCHAWCGEPFGLPALRRPASTPNQPATRSSP